MVYPKMDLEKSFLRGVFFVLGTIISEGTKFLHIRSILAFFKNPSKPLFVRVTAFWVNLFYIINIVMFIKNIVFL